MPSLRLNPEDDPSAVARELRRLSLGLDKGDRRLAELALARCDFLASKTGGHARLDEQVAALRQKAEAILGGG